MALDEIGDAQPAGAVLHRTATSAWLLRRLLSPPVPAAIPVRITGGGAGAA
jgi:hypothetical protein